MHSSRNMIMNAYNEAINNKLKEYGFKTDHSYGYMWYVEHFNVMRPAVLRRGLIRAEK